MIVLPQRLFDTDWHQLKVLVRSGRVTSYLDGVKVEEQLLSAVTPIYIDGKIQVAKKVKMEATVPVSFVSFSFFLIVFNVICTFWAVANGGFKKDISSNQ